jgi:hypothetical protein
MAFVTPCLASLNSLPNEGSLAQQGPDAPVSTWATVVRVCITSDGAIIGADLLARRLGPLPPDVEFANYVTGAMGYAWVDQSGVGYQVRLHPSKMGPKAEAALYFFLLEGRPERVLVTLSFSEMCQHWLYGSAADAVQGITRAIVAERQKGSRRFHSRSADPAALRGFPSLQHLLDLYRSDRSLFNPSKLQRLFPVMRESRFLLVERVERKDVLLLRSVGNGYQAFDSKWSTSSAGLRLEEQPDVDYGTWLTHGYLAAIDGEAPKTEEVDAIIYRPRQGRRRFTYRRLMLPFSGDGGRQFLLSASMPDLSVDLRGHQIAEIC